LAGYLFMWCGGVAKSGAAERRKAVLRCGGCFERRCGGNGGVAEMRCGGVAETADAAEKLMLWCGKTAVLRNFSAAVVDLIGLWRLADIRAASRAAPVSAFNCGQRSCDQLSPKLAADCDGGGDFRGESFGSPVFSGVRGRKVGVMSLMADDDLSRRREAVQARQIRLAGPLRGLPAGRRSNPSAGRVSGL
jgi:hypothetical protein